MSDTSPEPNELSKSDLKAKIASLETENEIMKAGLAQRRPIVDTGGLTAGALVLAAIVLTIWSTLDPEVAFSGIISFLAGGAFATGIAKVS